MRWNLCSSSNQILRPSFFSLTIPKAILKARTPLPLCPWCCFVPGPFHCYSDFRLPSRRAATGGLHAKPDDEEALNDCLAHNLGRNDCGGKPGRVGEWVLEINCVASAGPTSLSAGSASMAGFKWSHGALWGSRPDARAPLAFLFTIFSVASSAMQMYRLNDAKLYLTA